MAETLERSDLAAEKLETETQVETMMLVGFVGDEQSTGEMLHGVAGAVPMSFHHILFVFLESEQA